MEGLGDGVVAAMGDDQIHQRNDLGLRQEFSTNHIVSKLELSVLWAFAHNESVLRG